VPSSTATADGYAVLRKAMRKQGPIATVVNRSGAVDQPAYTRSRGVSVPAFAGTTCVESIVLSLISGLKSSPGVPARPRLRDAGHGAGAPPSRKNARRRALEFARTALICGCGR